MLVTSLLRLIRWEDFLTAAPRVDGSSDTSKTPYARIGQASFKNAVPPTQNPKQNLGGRSCKGP
jgi:hypothetical protein